MYNICQCESASHHHKGKCKNPIDRPVFGKCDQCQNPKTQHGTRHFEAIEKDQADQAWPNQQRF